MHQSIDSARKKKFSYSPFMIIIITQSIPWSINFFAGSITSQLQSACMHIIESSLHPAKIHQWGECLLCKLLWITDGKTTIGSFRGSGLIRSLSPDTCSLAQALGAVKWYGSGSDPCQVICPCELSNSTVVFNSKIDEELWCKDRHNSNCSSLVRIHKPGKC